MSAAAVRELIAPALKKDVRGLKVWVESEDSIYGTQIAQAQRVEHRRQSERHARRERQASGEQHRAPVDRHFGEPRRIGGQDVSTRPALRSRPPSPG